MLRLWRKWIAYPIGWLLLMGVILLLVTLSSGLGKTYDDMESFDGRYLATRNGDQVSLQITETIKVHLFAEHGIERNLITRYGEQDLGLGDIRVRDESGQPVKFTSRTNLNNHDIELRIGDPTKTVSGLQTYVISYTQSRAMVGGRDYQELYFNTNGTEWPNGFRSVTAELTVDPELAGSLNGKAWCYQGRGGSTQRCAVSHEANRFSIDVGRLGPRENATLAVGFNQGTVANPLAPFGARSMGWFGIGLMVAIGAGALALALLVRALIRDLKHGETGVVTEFTPPEDLEPVVAADFLGRPEKGAAAHLAWLTLNGYGSVTGNDTNSAPGPGADLLDGGERRALLDDLRLTWESKDMGYRMRTLTEEMFGKEGKRVRLDNATSPWRLAAVHQLREELLDAKDLRHRLWFGPWLLGLGYIALILLGIVQIGLGLAGLGWWFLAGGLLAVMLLLLAVYVMPTRGRLTKHGREVRRHLMGLERFVTMSEANRIAWLQNAQDAPREDGLVKFYEKLLPWAIVFGVERSWAQLVGELYDRFPETKSPTVGAMPDLVGLTSWDRNSDDYYRRRSFVDNQSTFWDSRPDAGEGSVSRGFGDFFDAVGEFSSGSGSSDSSTRSSGRGWGGGGGSSSSFSSGGSSGGGSSGGGTGGGGGGRW